MRLTRFRGVDGTIYAIPNGDIRLVGNLSRGWARAVVDLILPGIDRRPTSSGCARSSRRRRTGSPRMPEFAGHSTEPPKLVGLLSADATTITMRVMLHTVPSQRDALDPCPARGVGGRAGPGRACGRPTSPTDGSPGLGLISRHRAGPPRRRCHISSTGASWPVQSTSCAAAWCTSMPSPSSGVAPCAAARSSQAVGRGT